MSILLTIEEELHTLFEKYASAPSPVCEIARRGFAAPALKERQRLLLVGLNPSYPESPPVAGSHFYVATTAKNAYFTRIKALAEAIAPGQGWNYQDLLFLRETDQKQVIALTNDPQGLQFIVDQLRLSMQLMEALQPELIVVCNALSRRFMGYDRTGQEGAEKSIWTGYTFEFDQRFGVHVISGLHAESIKKGVKQTRLQGVPVLFTSTLTYMDQPSRKRLVWQARQILEHFRDFATGPNNHLRKQIQALEQLFRKTSSSKEEAIGQNHYEAAAQLRDQETAALKRIVDLLVMEAKGKEGEQ